MIRRDNALWHPVKTAQLMWSDGVLRSADYGDIYFSGEDPVAETRYVFIDGSDLARRFAALPADGVFTLAELGVGTGLNLVLALAAWHQHAPDTARLHYVGIDAHPIERRQLKSITSRWPELAQYYDALLHDWPQPLPGAHRRHLMDTRATLDFWWETAADALDDLASHDRRWVDAWFLDGFAPTQNPDMWQPSLWPALSQLSKPGATVTTFTAAGSVRRGLESAGFAMQKRPGFGRKRESLNGVLEQPKSGSCSVTPWDAPGRLEGQHIAVIGAGLAGACAARALARRGLSVDVIEAGQIAGGGSSNRQGITYTRLSRRFGELSDFAQASYQYSLPFYRALFAHHGLNEGSDGQFCGYLQLSDDQKTLSALSGPLATVDGFADVVSAERASELAGLPLTEGGIWYPEAAWLHPQAMVRALLDHDGITVHAFAGDASLDAERPTRVHTLTTTRDYDAVVVAGAWGSRQLPGLDWLPLQPIRGQTTSITSQPPLERLRTVICRKGYLPPAVDGQHCIGASFGPGDAAVDEREDDHAHNIRELRAALTTLDVTPERRGGHVALRCNSNDYLPIVGAVTDASRFAATYPALRSHRRAVVDTLPPLRPGVWCLTALGSRGLTAAPLAAELLAAQMCNEPPPLPRYLQRALSPARFLARQLARGEL